MSTQTISAGIRAGLDHPVIDCDAHILEYAATFVDYLRRVGGSDFADKYVAKYNAPRPQPTLEERRYRRKRRAYWWGSPTTPVKDAVTPFLPRLMHERMDDFGLDVSILYPTVSNLLGTMQDDEDRLAAIRAMNMMNMDLYNREFSDRLIVPAIIPMKHPREALAELDYAVGELGFKSAMVLAGVWRPIKALYDRFPGIEAFRPDGIWLDTYGMDSEYDYDPVWAKFVELGVAVTCHGVAAPDEPYGEGRSISNWTFNHIANQPQQQKMLCKSLYFGGVTRRFPTLSFAFLECGVGWACSLIADIVSHWNIRNLDALENVNPANLDRQAAERLMLEYGGERFARGLNGIFRITPDENEPPAAGEKDDDFAALKIGRKEDLGELFSRFYFGCEAGDPMNATAFNPIINPFGKTLNAIFSSDIGHFDVPDMTEVLGEVHELLEHGALSPEDFRKFTADNVIRLHGEMNPGFWNGTPVESYAAGVLANSPPTGAA